MNDSIRFSDAMDGVAAAKAAVKNKIVVADKLGKLWRVLEIIEAIGEPLKDVSC